MEDLPLLPRILALFVKVSDTVSRYLIPICSIVLSVCFALPTGPAFALRQTNVYDNVGLEEDIAKALGGQPVPSEPGTTSTFIS